MRLARGVGDKHFANCATGTALDLESYLIQIFLGILKISFLIKCYSRRHRDQRGFVLGIRDVTYKLKHSREANPFDIEKKIMCDKTVCLMLIGTLPRYNF